jgi:hypothetical protein
MRSLTGMRRISWLLWGLVGGLAFCFYDVFLLPQVLKEQKQLLTSAHNLPAALGLVKSDRATGASRSAPGVAAAQSRGAQVPHEQRSRLSDATAQLIRDSNAALDQYTKSTEGITPTALLSPESLVDRAHIRAGSDRLDSWERALTVYEHDDAAVLATYESKMKELGGVSDDDDARQRRQRLTEINRSTITEIRLMYDFMSKRAGKVRLKGGKLLFSSDADMNVYRTHIARINDLGRESAELDRVIQQKRDEATARLRAMANPAAAQ